MINFHNIEIHWIGSKYRKIQVNIENFYHLIFLLSVNDTDSFHRDNEGRTDKIDNKTPQHSTTKAPSEFHRALGNPRVKTALIVSKTQQEPNDKKTGKWGAQKSSPTSQFSLISTEQTLHGGQEKRAIAVLGSEWVALRVPQRLWRKSEKNDPKAWMMPLQRFELWPCFPTRGIAYHMRRPIRHADHPFSVFHIPIITKATAAVSVTVLQVHGIPIHACSDFVYFGSNFGWDPDSLQEAQWRQKNPSHTKKCPSRDLNSGPLPSKEHHAPNNLGITWLHHTCCS